MNLGMPKSLSDGRNSKALIKALDKAIRILFATQELHGNFCYYYQYDFNCACSNAQLFYGLENLLKEIKTRSKM